MATMILVRAMVVLQEACDHARLSEKKQSLNTATYRGIFLYIAGPSSGILLTPPGVEQRL